MAAITGSVYKSISPNLGKTVGYIETPISDSADTVDVAGYFDEVDMVIAFDKTDGAAVTATVVTTVITLDAAGGNTDHIYTLMIVGNRA